MNIEKLISEIESAERGTSDLNVKIECVLPIENNSIKPSQVGGKVTATYFYSGKKSHGTYTVPRYTLSEESAMDLVRRHLKGKIVSSCISSYTAVAGVVTIESWEVEITDGRVAWMGQAKTLPLAICAAALEALNWPH